MKKENKVTPQLFKLTMSKLKDSHKLILFIGYSFIILAILSFMNIIILDLSTIIFISLSGILFILADFFEYYGVKISEKVNPQKKAVVDNIQIILLCKSALNFFAILFLILGSYIKLNLSESVLNNLSTALALIAIGLTIIKISLDNTKTNSDFGESILTEIGKAMEVAEKEK